MKVRLTRKHAECIDGVDLSHSCVGDILDLTQHDAELLLAHGWAIALESERRAAANDVSSRHPTAAPAPDSPLTISLPLKEDEEPA